MMAQQDARLSVHHGRGLPARRATHLGVTDPTEKSSEPTMRGKTVVITGATSGIGEIAAARLAQMGARLVLVARDHTRGEATLNRIDAVAPGLNHVLHVADLSRPAEVRGLAGKIAAAEARIDVLINNAGAVFAHRAVTADG